MKFSFCIACLRRFFGVWCNGNITVLGTVAVGSTPTTQIGGVLELVDRLVLGTSALGVRVRVPPPPNHSYVLLLLFGGIQVAKGGRL